MRSEVAFGACLREFRRQQGYSQEQLGMMCGLDRTFISMLERGHRQPSLGTLFNLSKALSMKPEDFVRAVREQMDEIDETTGPDL